MNFEKQAGDFRRAVARRGPRGRTTSHPAGLRERAVQYVEARVARGGTADGACRELGIGTDSFRRWVSEPPKEVAPAAPPACRPVKLTAAVSAAATAPGGMVIHGPGGLRIEGLDIDTLVELIRRLG